MADRRQLSTLAEAGILAAVLLLFATICYTVFARLSYHWNWEGILEYRKLFYEGWTATLLVSIGALALSLVLAILLVLASRSPSRVLRGTCKVFTEIIRGTPLLVQILLGYYVIANAFDIKTTLGVGIILLSLHSGAYLGEMLRGGIESVSSSQIEAARAVGFDRRQIYRHVIFPQALRRVLPAMTGEFALLVKNSSLLSVIGIEELTQQARIANSATYSALEGYLPLAVGYLLLTLPLMYLARRMERRLRYVD